MFYKPLRNAVDFSGNEQLTPIKTRTSDGIQLGGFLIHPKNRENMSERTIVYMHGVSINPKERLPELMQTADEFKCQIVFFCYRGYAYSQEALVTEAGICLDAQAILDWVVENSMILGHDIYLHGKSMGTAVATYTVTELVSREGPTPKQLFKGLILECGFTTAQKIINMKVGPKIAQTFMSDIKWETEERIVNVEIPTLFIHGDKDEMCPHTMSEELQRKLPGSKLVIIPGGGHNNMYQIPQYYEALKQFL